MQSPSTIVRATLLSLNKVLVLWPCHRIESRCPCICNIYLPVCFRCFGIIVGIPIGCVLLALLHIDTKWFGAVCFIPLLADVTMQYDFNIESNNIRRGLTGFCFGIGASIYLILWCKYNFI